MTCQDHDHIADAVPGCLECLSTLKAELEEARSLYSNHVNGLMGDLAVCQKENELLRKLTDNAQADNKACRVLIREAADRGWCPWCGTHAKKLGEPHSLGCRANGLLIIQEEDPQ